MSGTDLRSGHSQSCGCTKGEKLTINMIGKKFGKLEVLNKEKSNKKGLAMWKCKCDCDNIITVATSILVNNKITSYGCVKSKGEFKIIQILKENNIIF